MNTSADERLSIDGDTRPPLNRKGFASRFTWLYLRLFILPASLAPSGIVISQGYYCLVALWVDSRKSLGTPKLARTDQGAEQATEITGATQVGEITPHRRQGTW